MTTGVGRLLRSRFHPSATLPLLLLSLIVAFSCTGCSEDEEEALVLVWSDEFDGAQGTAPDSTKWRYDVGGGGWGNQQLEYDTDSTENVQLDGNGNLAIIAREQAFGGRDYTSGRINTRDLFDQAFTTGKTNDCDRAAVLIPASTNIECSYTKPRCRVFQPLQKAYGVRLCVCTKRHLLPHQDPIICHQTICQSS